MVDPATNLLNIVFILGLKDVLQFSDEIMTTVGCGSRALNSVMAKHMTGLFRNRRLEHIYRSSSFV